MDETSLAASLADSGLILLGMVDRSAPFVPPTLATFAATCSEESMWSFKGSEP